MNTKGSFILTTSSFETEKGKPRLHCRTVGPFFKLGEYKLSAQSCQVCLVIGQNATTMEFFVLFTTVQLHTLMRAKALDDN